MIVSLICTMYLYFTIFFTLYPSCSTRGKIRNLVLPDCILLRHGNLRSFNKSISTNSNEYSPVCLVLQTCASHAKTALILAAAPLGKRRTVAYSKHIGKGIMYRNDCKRLTNQKCDDYTGVDCIAGPCTPVQEWSSVLQLHARPSAHVCLSICPWSSPPRLSSVGYCRAWRATRYPTRNQTFSWGSLAEYLLSSILLCSMSR